MIELTQQQALKLMQTEAFKKLAKRVERMEDEYIEKMFTPDTKKT